MTDKAVIQPHHNIAPVVVIEPQFVLEIGHSKSGSNHVLIIKKLRVSADNEKELFEQMEQALVDWNCLLGEHSL